jgi:hypothetical protein
MIYLNREKRVFFLVISILVVFSLLISLTYADSDSFLKKGTYSRNVVIETPENNPLAEAFLRNGITVYSQPQYGNSSFSFKTSQEGNKFIVFLYYKPRFISPADSEYVGKYTYYKKNPNEANIIFVDSFVKWLFENAWANKS